MLTEGDTHSNPRQLAVPEVGDCCLHAGWSATQCNAMECNSMQHTCLQTSTFFFLYFHHDCCDPTFHPVLCNIIFLTPPRPPPTACSLHRSLRLTHKHRSPRTLDKTSSEVPRPTPASGYSSVAPRVRQYRSSATLAGSPRKQQPWSPGDDDGDNKGDENP